MKKSAIIRVCVWTAVVMLLAVALIVGVGGGSLFDRWERGTKVAYSYDNADEYIAGDAAVSAAGIRAVEVHWVSGQVHVEVYDGADITFSESADSMLDVDDQLYYRVKDGKLTIEFRKSNNSIFNLRSLSKTLTLRLPRTLTLSTLRIENVSSSIHAQGGGLQVGTIDIENVSGAINLHEFVANRLELESVSGSVSVMGNYTVISAQSVSGSSEYRLGVTPDKMNVESVSGAIKVYLPGERGFTAQMDALSGRLDSELGAMDGRHAARYGNGEAKLQFECLSGSVSLLKGDAWQPVQPLAGAKADPQPAATAEKGNPVPSSQRGF